MSGYIFVSDKIIYLFVTYNYQFCQTRYKIIIIVDKNEEDNISEKENSQNEMMIEENNGEEGEELEEEGDANKLTKSSSASEKPQARQLKAGIF